uniref:Small ribosomal subunit protein uS3c n=1 Tax=Halamphora americana TaxID=2305497 RepID=A0A516ZB32_9STRA|nr:ribosomal protein S3 [Halamphora americana]QDR24909.1 ribosomal protein S3 [Halamphora americana]
MGQKTHPLGFRLGITQDHKSTWYANLNKYANVLKEDNTIRTYIETISKVNSISNVKINRNGLNDQIQLNIETGKPGILVGDLGSGLENLLNKIKKILPSNRQLTINVLEVEKVDLDATLLADLVAEQLEKRVAFKRAMREALQRAQKQNVKGIKIQVSGRLNGAEIARSEWVREGRVPLQTLRADIDYATKEANTIYGVLGIKIWLFRGEILSK